MKTTAIIIITLTLVLVVFLLPKDDSDNRMVGEWAIDADESIKEMYQAGYMPEGSKDKKETEQLLRESMFTPEKIINVSSESYTVTTKDSETRTQYTVEEKGADWALVSNADSEVHERWDFINPNRVHLTYQIPEGGTVHLTMVLVRKNFEQDEG